MAGDWIALRHALRTDSAVMALVDALSRWQRDICPAWVPPVSHLIDQCIGALHNFWSLVDNQSADGLLRNFTAERLDELVGFPGFAATLITEGWLVFGDNSLEVPNFERWMGASAKRRLKAAQKKRRQRSASSEVETGDICPPMKGTAKGPKGGPEKRREEVKKQETSSPGEAARAAPPARGGGPRTPAKKQQRVAALIDVLVQFPDLAADEAVRREWAEAIREQAERGRLPTDRRARGILNEALVRASRPGGLRSVAEALREWWVSGRQSPAFTYAPRTSGDAPAEPKGSRLRDVSA